MDGFVTPDTTGPLYVTEPLPTLRAQAPPVTIELFPAT
jgi:hypothetical protein